jgi:hypothetical protein
VPPATGGLGPEMKGPILFTRHSSDTFLKRLQQPLQ